MAATAVLQKSCIRQSSKTAFFSHIMKMFPVRHLAVSPSLNQRSCSRLHSSYPAGSVSQSAIFRKRRGIKQSSLCDKISGKEKSRLLATLRSSNLDSGGESVLIAGKHILRSDIRIFVASFITILLAISNKVLYKMALVPLQNYPFFLAQVTTFGYVLVYFSILFFRYMMGIVTNEMLALPKNLFVALGALEAMGIATGMAAAAILPGASVLVLHQVYLIWQLLLSYALLGKHYTWGQVGGCLLVLFGIVIVISSGGARVDLHHTSHFWSLLMIVSSGFAAGAAILKEFVFHDATQHSKAASVDLFVVNSFGSGFQALFVLLLLPILSRLRGIPFNQLPSYMRDGSACFFNVGNVVKECDGAPLVPLLYILVNLTFNISALNLLKMSSAIVSSLSMTLAVPFSIWMFTLPLPYLGTPSAATPGLFLGAFVLVVGLALYNISGQGRSFPAHN